MPPRSRGPIRIDILHEPCGHTSRGVVIDCLNTALVPRWRRQPCPACQKLLAPRTQATHTESAAATAAADTRGENIHDQFQRQPPPG